VGEFDTLQKLYKKLKLQIDNRLLEFKNIWDRFDKYEILFELIFCILTPQSKARVCWETVKKIKETNAFINLNKSTLKNCLYGVRFPNNKLSYLSQLRLDLDNGKIDKILEIIKTDNDVKRIREILVKNIKGFGYKEASHFLRNIWIGRKLAILDRHILKNLKKYGIIDSIDYSMSRRHYLYIEKRIYNFSKNLGIPIYYIDFIFWYNETGDIFK